MTLIRRTAILALAAALSSACVATGSLKRDLYPKAAAAPPSSARVALVRRPGPPAKLHHREMPWTSVDIDLSGYPQAAAAMLSSLYDRVSVTTSAAEASGADFLVFLDTGYPETIGLSFRDPAGRTLASFSRPGLRVPDAPDADSALAKILTPPGFLVSFGTLGIAFAYRAIQARDQISLELSTTTAAALADLRSRIALDSALLPSSAAAPWTSPPTCTAALTDPQAPPEVHLSCAGAAEAARAWRQAAAHLRAYLSVRGEASDAAELRRRLAELEARP